MILPVLLAVFTVSAYGEEVGWQGYAFEPLEVRRGTFGAGFVLGIFWAVWHIIPYLQTHNPAGWIFWQCVFTVAFRLLIVWFYTNTGRSIFAAIVVHTMSNVAVFMTPNYGSQYDPFLTSIITGALVVILYSWRLQPYQR